MEAIVMHEGTDRVVIDLDPIDVQVAVELEGTYRYANGSDQSLINLVEAAYQYAIVATDDDLMIVWSDTRKAIKAFCTSCGDPFVADEMLFGDQGLVCAPCFD